MANRKELTEKEYDAICQVNREHGRLLVTDLHVLETVIPDVYTPAPKFLPKGVVRDQGIKWVLSSDLPPRRRETIEGLDVREHDGEVQYEKVWEESEEGGRLIDVRRILSQPSIDTSFREVSGHYHVSSLDWYHRQTENGLGRPLIALGLIANFDELLAVLNREVLIYRGEIEPPKPKTVMVAPRPANELGTATFREFLMGIRVGTIELGKPSETVRIENALDRLP